ncbi:MAG: translation initiation factor IF-2 [Candidatus Omnitrophota bacterium]
MRINQIAQKFGLKNKDILDYLDSIGVSGKSHSSALDEGTMELLLQHFGKLEKEDEPAPKTDSKFAKIRRPKGWKPSPEKMHEEEEAVRPAPSPVVEAAGEPLKESRAVPTVEAEVPPAPPKPPAPLYPSRPEPRIGLTAAGKIKEDLEEKAAARGDRRRPKPSQKKPKPKSVRLEPQKEPKGEPEIIIETPEIDISVMDTALLEKPLEIIVEKEKEIAVKHDQDEAIRREIQKLKAKQKRQAEVEVKKPEAVIRPERRREVVAKGRGKRAWKREKRERREMQMAAEETRLQRDSTILKVHDATTVADIADGLHIPVNELIQKLISLGVMASINQRLDAETVQIVADDYGFRVEQIDMFDNEIFTETWEDDADESRAIPRPPVVTIMGHVDHGKTKLLDAVRSTDVVSQEAGGITQHIGAYYVKTAGGDIVFLDTPGHEAFTTMRARGAMVTDIVVLVVSAADGVMPQTKEAIAHAKAADVPMIVAINKIDLDSANPERVKQQLAEQGLVAEDWGGNTVMVPISAKQKIGIDALLESILLQAELLELHADPQCRVRGTIIESRLEQGRGPVATVLVEQGTLRIGEPFVTGVYSGRVRAMLNDRGETIQEAGPSWPVEILGIEDVPSAGDPFIVVKDDNQAKQLSAKLRLIQRERELRRTRHVTLEDLHMQIEEGEIKELRIIVKGDVQGSVGAVCDNLNKIESEKVRIDILHSGVGSIAESDVMLASASNAVIIGFNVRPHPQVAELAKREHVDLRTYRIIYDAISDIKNAMTGMLDKTFKEKILGRGEIREVFRLSRGISIAGSFVQDGHLQRNAPVRLLRDSVVIHEGKLSSLKRFKDDVREVPSGYECGIGLEKWNDIRVGDVVECYELEEVAPTL